MKKNVFIIFFTCILLLTIIPVDFNLALKTRNKLIGDLYIDSVEPIQVIKDADTLVKDKLTVIRVIIQSTFSEEIQLKVNLTYDFGTKTYLENGYGSFGFPIRSGTNILYAPGGPCLPGWTYSWGPDDFFKWTHIGNDALIKVELDPNNEIEETNEGNNIKFADSITVADAPQFRVLFLPVAFPDEDDWTLSASKVVPQKDFLLATYPLAEIDLYCFTGSLWRISSDPGSTITDKDWLYEVVAYPIACTARIMGFNRVVIALKKYFGGTGVAIGINKRPPILEPVVISSTFPDNDNVAHEIGHTFYLWHPQDIGPPIFETERYDVKEKDFGDTVDTFMSYRDDPTWIDKERYDGIPYTLNPAGPWHYPGDPECGIPPQDKNLIEFPSWSLVDQLTIEPPTYTCIMVHGTLHNDGSIKVNNNWYRIQATPDFPQQHIMNSENNDNYQISLLNNYHQTIAIYPFFASLEYISHIDEIGVPEVVKADYMPLILNVPELVGTRYIQIQDINGQVLAEKEITINKPLVTVTYPNGGEQFKIGDTIALEWEGIDQDQDTLGYTIGYSNDNGFTWIPLAFDIKETTFEWNTKGLSIGDYLIKVIASDGVNTGEDISDGTFTLPKNKHIDRNYPYSNLLNLLENNKDIIRLFFLNLIKLKIL